MWRIAAFHRSVGATASPHRISHYTATLNSTVHQLHSHELGMCTGLLCLYGTTLLIFMIENAPYLEITTLMTYVDPTLGNMANVNK